MKTKSSTLGSCLYQLRVDHRAVMDRWEKWWRNPEEVQLNQFIEKDDVVYHSVIFPASRLGIENRWTKVHHLSTTDHLTYEGGKF